MADVLAHVPMCLKELWPRHLSLLLEETLDKSIPFSDEIGRKDRMVSNMLTTHTACVKMCHSVCHCP